ncbi:MAG: glycosyltransferase family 4 protein [Actinomycetota bacterium]|nr:glycosyltransferase family 4 protein [Actinomycetota bacterium]
MIQKKVLICESVVPFIFGGAELLVRGLKRAMEQAGLEVDIVSIPYFWDPPERILENVSMWRNMRLDELTSGDVDLVIATKFPTYACVHSKKVAWVFHQHRGAYELRGTIYDDFSRHERSCEYRKRIMDIDRECLGECVSVFSLSKRISCRLRENCGIMAKSLYHPPPYTGSYRSGSFSKNVLIVSRLEPLKRVDLAVRAMRHVRTKGARLKIVGEGLLDEPLRELARTEGVSERVDFEGFVSVERLLELYANCGCVLYVPFDEDYGYVPLEAFMSGKPVVVTEDSGGAVEFVRDGENGEIAGALPEEIAEAIDSLLQDKSRARKMGKAGWESVRNLSWKSVLEELVMPFL